MKSVPSVEAEQAKGLIGDRYHGTRHRHVTIQSAEALAEAGAELGAPVDAGSTRRNITISHDTVPSKPGDRLRVGPVDLEVVRIAAPCKLLDDIISPGARTALRRRAGSVCRVLTSGPITVGDPVELGRKPLWRDIRNEGIVVHGPPLTDVAQAVVGQVDAHPNGDRSPGPGLREQGQEYAEAAAVELGEGRVIAVTSLAINAADPVCSARLGRRAASHDHDQALTLLRGAGKDGAAVEKDLRQLLPMKTRAEYEPEAIPASAATRAVERAQRCVIVARRVTSR